MSIFKRLSGKRKEIQSIKNPFSLIEDSPCLAPWYFNKHIPLLKKEDKILEWRGIGSEGVIALTNGSTKHYALINMGSYVIASDDGKSFLTWKRNSYKTFGLESIEILYYEIDNFSHLENIDKAISEMKQRDQGFYAKIEPSAKIVIAFDPREDAVKFEFPIEFKKFKEFIILKELKNLYEIPDSKTHWHNTTMLLIKPDTGWVFNYPQDWFNKSNADFGYEWITRAIRNPKTNLIHGTGIRIRDFVLDETNRQLFNNETSIINT